jgi:cytochrome d ubiquinol oxidase subunit I
MYLAVFGTGIRYMLMLVAKGPQPYRQHTPEPEGQSRRPARPLSAIPDRIDPAIELPVGTRR